MKTFPHLFTKLFCAPLLIEPNARHGLEIGLLGHMGLMHGGSPVPQMAIAPQRTYGEPAKPYEEHLQYLKAAEQTRKAWRVERIYQTFGNVAVVQMHGVIDKHLTDFEMSCYGGYDIADFDNALSRAANDPKIERIVLDINSPGGSVSGVPESAARVAELTKTKEVHAFVDVMAASAAFYVASQADVIAAAPSAILGSIGVYLTILDATRAAEMEGYKVELIRAGKFKAMGSPFRPLSDDERSMLQERVNGIHAEFRAAVSSGRGTNGAKMGSGGVSSDDMEGQIFFAKEAVAKNLCDVLTGMNLDEYVASLL